MKKREGQGRGRGAVSEISLNNEADKGRWRMVLEMGLRSSRPLKRLQGRICPAEKRYWPIITI
jgi:hypothetical protein